MLRILAIALLAALLTSAYQVTYPGDSQGWNTTGPNVLEWQRVSTDPLNFTAVLTNVNSPVSQVMNTFVDGTVGSVVCNAPQGGWTAGSAFRVNLVQDPAHLDTILAQSNEFNITAVSSSGSTTSSASAQTTAATSAGTATASSTSGVSTTSSKTSTTPTGTSGAARGADTRAVLLTAVAALTAFVATLF